MDSIRPRRERENAPTHSTSATHGAVERARAVSERQGVDAASIDTTAADADMHSIWNDPKRKEMFRNLGGHLYPPGSPERAVFASLCGKMEDRAHVPMAQRGIADYTADERVMRNDVLATFINHETIARSCEQMLTTDLFTGMDRTTDLGEVVTDVGEARALGLVKQRVVRLVEENDGARLEQLHQSLRRMKDLYNTMNFRSVTSRIARLGASEHLVTEQKYADLTRGDANPLEVTNRAFGDFSKDLSWLRTITHARKNYWAGVKVGFASWREQRSGAMQELRDERTHVLGILGPLLDERFIDDQERMIGSGESAEQAEQSRSAIERQVAQQLSLAEDTRFCHAQWRQHLTTTPHPHATPAERELEYDRWINTDYPGIRNHRFQDTKRASGSAINQFLMDMFQAIFNNGRANRIPDPSFA